ncbi:MAG: TrbG/VirB9 family P-type conjugative transfer protein [Pseudomonadota bacterium]
MNGSAILLGLLLALAAPALAARAEQAPRPGAVDSRIRSVFYDPDQVVAIRGYFGYQMMIEFGPGERIENVSIGDALAWQVTPNHKASLLFLKPIDGEAATNMTVVTDERRYVFALSARRAGKADIADMAYVVRFVYPPPPPAPPAPPPPAPPERRNLAYTYTGSRALLPSLVFDDGHFTYFQWPPTTAIPALFLVGPDGAESIVNFSIRDGFLVVEQVAPRFALRNGKELTLVINDAWRDPLLTASAPRPHIPPPKKRRGLFGWLAGSSSTAAPRSKP